MTVANLAGQMHVRLVELHKRTHLLADVRMLDDGQPAFLTMPFDEAVQFWTDRGGDPALLDDVIAAYRRKAALAGDQSLDTLAQRVVDGIRRTLESGGTLADFAKAVEQGGTDDIASPMSDDYLDLVFRTNMLGAYGAGRYAQLQNPDVIAARPYRQWRTMEDERVRPEHAAGDGMTWRADDPSFANVMAPGGFRCRCVVVSGDDEDLASWGGVVDAAPRSGFEITPGFGAEAF